MIDIFTIEKIASEDNVFSYKAHINKDSKIFQGHFPDKPVIPGVCSIDLIKQCLKDIQGNEVEFNEIKECKFTGAILPSQHSEVSVELKLQEKNSEIHLTALVFDEETTFVKLKATIK